MSYDIDTSPIGSITGSRVKTEITYSANRYPAVEIQR